MILLKDRLIKMRERNQLTQEKLAKLSNVSRRQIARIESERDAIRRKTTVDRLANALLVEPRVLTGELPLPDEVGSQTTVGREVGADTESVSARVSPEVRLAYDLVSTCFGISLSDIVRVAPLLLAVLAVASFAWRKEKAKEANQLLEQLSGLNNDVPRDKEGMSHRFHHFLHLGWEVEEMVAYEEEAINDRDLFGTGEGFEYGNGQAFSDYLRALAAEAECSDIVASGDIGLERWKHLPQTYRVCSDTLIKLSGGCEEFLRALENFELRVQDIPKIFMADFAGVFISPSIKEFVEAAAELRVKWFDGWRSGQHPEEIQLLLDWEREDEERTREMHLRVQRKLAERRANRAAS